MPMDVEFQTTNAAGFGLRMHGNYYRLISRHGKRVVQTVICRGCKERARASGTLLVPPGKWGIEKAVNQRLKESDVINILENEVLGPLIQLEIESARKDALVTGLQEGKKLGRQDGRREGMQDLLKEQLTEKFGALPAWAAALLQSASNEDLHTWAKRVLHSASIEDTLR